MPNTLSRQREAQRRSGADRSAEDFNTLLAQLVVVAAIVITVWSLGGYYPLARFTALAMLGCAFVLFCLTPDRLRPSRLIESISPGKPILIVLLLLMGLGAIQFVGTPSWLPMDWTGVQQIRNEFAGADDSGSDVLATKHDLAQADPAVQPSLTIDPWATKTWLAMAAIGVAGFFLGAVLFRSSRSRLLLLITLVATGVSQVIWGIVQVVRRPDEILLGVELDGTSDLFGTFVNRNHAADFLGMSLAAAIGLAWWCYRSDTKKTRFTYDVQSVWQRSISNPTSIGIWLCVVWLFIGVISTLSRGGWISVGIGLLVVPLCWKRENKRRNGGLIATLAGFGLIAFFALQFSGLGDRVDKRLDDLELENLLADARLTHWLEALPALEHFLPLGSGLGTYGFAYIPFEPEPDNVWFTHAHNQYLETAMEAGVPGLILLLAGMWFAAIVCLRLCQPSRDYTKEALGIAALAALAIQSLHAWTDFGLMMPANLLTFSVLMGAAAAASHRTRAVPKIRSESGQPSESIHDVNVVSNPSAADRWTGSAMAITSTALVGLILVAATWHQQRCVRSATLLQATEFSPQTPSPTTETADAWMEDIESEMKRSPDNLRLLGRKIQLQFHRAQRATYDQVVRGQNAATLQSQPIRNWNLTSLESVIWNIFNDSPETKLTDQQRVEYQTLVRQEPHLSQAWSDLLRSLQGNPVQPRTHYRLAMLGAASGRNWRPYFDHSVKLSVVDPNLSLGNGLLAWAAGDRDVMINQFRQTLATDSGQVPLIFNILRLQLSRQEMIERLTPTRWVVPYRMARMIDDQAEYRQLHSDLMNRADSLAQTTLSDKLARSRARGMIAAAQGEHDVAIKHFRNAAETDPKNPELRYRLALSLIRAGQPKEAVNVARVAHHLSPTVPKYRDLFNQAKHLHRKDFEANHGSNKIQ